MKTFMEAVREIVEGLMDLLYPPRCLLCRVFLAEGEGHSGDRRILFCDACLAGFPELTGPVCRACSKPFAPNTGEDHFCEDCLRRRPRYEALHAPYVYAENLMSAIHHLKYGARPLFAGSLGPLLGRYARKVMPDGGQMLVMPVPLHPKRLRERGFNQSLLLARHVAKSLRAPLDFMGLRRERHTLPQTGLSREERRKNMRRAFRLTPQAKVRGRTILLVDDVATTGNTLEECARVLRKAGSERVVCLVLARAANPYDGFPAAASEVTHPHAPAMTHPKFSDKAAFDS